MFTGRSSIGIVFLLLLISSCTSDLPDEIEFAYQSLPEVIDYNFHVKPILSDKCYACHGPDENTRRAGLRLDLEDAAFAALNSGNVAIKKGNVRRSALIHRILAEDEQVQMPPPEFKNPLNSQEIATLHKWIEQGAEWKPHWSFIPPQKPEITPNTPDASTSGNVIDHFINTRLAREDLTPNGEADKERLIRRVTMDLTGLPPTLEEVDQFIRDTSPEAYEKVINRLMTSPQFGERLAMEWMDLSRYADSHGMHADGWRLMWPWRDWVIDAFNDNMPYDQFVTWQLAGDLLPQASREQILATAFHRNHAMTAEGGAIDEEFRLEYVADRTNTTATAFMGLTMECAKCHDHKFDPISQKEYYQLSSFFNNVKELGMTGDDGNYGPMLLMSSKEEQQQIDDLKAQISNKEKSRQLTLNEVMNIKDMVGKNDNPSKHQLEGYFPLDHQERKKNKGGQLRTYFDGNDEASSPGEPQLVEGKIGLALEHNEDYEELYLSKVGLFEAYEPYSAAIWINSEKRDSTKTQVIMGTAGEKNNFWRGWDFYLDEQNRLCFRLIHSLPHNYLHVRSTAEIDTAKWVHVGFTYDGSLKARGATLYIDGQETPTEIAFDNLYKTTLPIRAGNHQPDERPIRVGKSYRAYTGESGFFLGRLDEIYLYKRVISDMGMSKLALKEIEAPVEAKQRMKALRNPQVVALNKEIEELRKTLLEIVGPIDEVMVMEEMPSPRKTFVRARGEYNSPAEQVAASTPEAVLPFPDDLPKNRLGLSQWLFSKDNPLTARVAVNRYWQMIFGRGIVKTINDFGSQGSLPSHPELLDWLAVEFMESGWDVKALMKLIVTSDTYRRSSAITPEAYEKDPENIYLSRAPSYRWPAEMIRDNALAASGLLVKKVGGASVKPYQPDGLWIELGNFSHKLLHYKEDKGDKLYRRSLYTFIRRTSPPPFMTTFDVPNRDVCVVQRERTNTPLQALVLLNDPQFVEAAKKMAERSMSQGTEMRKNLAYAFRLATTRSPNQDELDILSSYYQEQVNQFRKNPAEANRLLNIGESAINVELDKTSLAAMTMVANTMLNHDEAYMRR